MKTTWIGSLARTSLSGVWYRTVSSVYLAAAIRTAHAAGKRSRFSSGGAYGLQILYLAETPLTAQMEVGALYGSPLAGIVYADPSAPTFVTISVSVSLTDIVDLSNPAQAGVLDSNAQELTGDWQGYSRRSGKTSVAAPTGTAPTQELGEQLFLAASAPAVKGFTTVSAKMPTQRILGIFTPRLVKGTDSVGYAHRHEDGILYTDQMP